VLPPGGLYGCTIPTFFTYSPPYVELGWSLHAKAFEDITEKGEVGPNTVPVKLSGHLVQWPH